MAEAKSYCSAWHEITDPSGLNLTAKRPENAYFTFQNAGVVLETGIALGTKPNDQIVLITQGSHEELHFDLRNNNVISYNPKGSVSEIADAIVAAARHFESQVEHHIDSVVRRLQ